VQTDGHDPVGRIECLLDAVSVVDVDVDVEDSFVIPEELEDAEDDVVDVAEPGRLRLFRVMKPSSPVDGDIALVSR
jgi:hypothetical protein